MFPRLGRPHTSFRIASLALATALLGTSPALAGGPSLATQMAPDEHRGLVGIYIFEDDAGATGGAKIEKILESSPAAKAGLKPGDVVVTFNGDRIGNGAALAKRLAAVQAGDQLKIEVEREGWRKELSLTAAARPEEKKPARPYMGISGEERQGGGLSLTQVASGGPADGAGLKAGDVILSIEGHSISSLEDLKKAMGAKKPGDVLAMVVERDGWKKETSVKLGARPDEESSSVPTTPPTEVRPPRTREVTPPAHEKRPGFLGVYLKDDAGGLSVESSLQGSPAERAGLKTGDVVVAVSGHPIADLAAFTEQIQQFGAGDTVKLGVRRDGWTRTVEVTLGERPAKGGEAPKTTERPTPRAEAKPGFLGIAVEEAKGGLKIVEVTPGSPAARLPLGAVITRVDGKTLKSIDDLAEILKTKHAGDTIELLLTTADGNGKIEAAIKLAPRED